MAYNQDMERENFSPIPQLRELGVIGKSLKIPEQSSDMNLSDKIKYFYEKLERVKKTMDIAEKFRNLLSRTKVISADGDYDKWFERFSLNHDMSSLTFEDLKNAYHSGFFTAYAICKLTPEHQQDP